jgi:hypothetical protein
VSTNLPSDEPKDRGFATARRAHDGRHFAARYCQSDTVEDEPLTISKGEIAQFNKGVVGVGHEKTKADRKGVRLLNDKGFGENPDIRFYDQRGKSE